LTLCSALLELWVCRRFIAGSLADLLCGSVVSVGEFSRLVGAVE
jgi:hypothetical protein